MFVDVILPIFAILGAGYIGKRIGIITPPIVDILNKVAFYGALPALVFYSIYSRSFEEIYSPTLLIGFYIIIFSTLAIASISFRNLGDNASKSTSLIQSYHGNLGYMGLPIVTLAFGEIAGAKASFLLGFGSPIQISLTMILLVYLNQVKAQFWDQLKQIFLNPVLVALLVGVAFSFLAISLPSTFQKVISYLGDTALPLALLGVGASIEVEGYRERLRSISSVAVLKIVMMPIMALGLFSLLRIDFLTLRTGVLMLGMPTAISTYIYSSELGGDGKLASLNVSFTTLLSLITISTLLFIFS